MWIAAPGHKIALVLTILWGLSGCNHPGNESSPADSTQVTVSLPGWVQVNFGIQQAYLKKNRGSMYDNYDEYVGGLFDNGMLLSNSHWYKPTYGNQNIIWVADAEIGSGFYQKISSQKDDSAFPGARTVVSKLVVNGTAWHYAGDMQTINRGENASILFQDYVFFCEKENADGISLFYWGDEMLIPAYENESLLVMLARLSPHCQ